jgi:hypothetical protein
VAKGLDPRKMVSLSKLFLLQSAVILRKRIGAQFGWLSPRPEEGKSDDDQQALAQGVFRVGH